MTTPSPQKPKNVPARDAKGLRTGFTTGACAAAAAKGAARLLVQGGERLQAIETTLPNGAAAAFALSRCEYTDPPARLRARASVVKDAGDDPDCTHGAEIVADVELTRTEGVVLRGGDGVATVTKPGLGLEVGEPAINPVPRRNITAMVLEEISGSDWDGAIVTLSVPGGEEMAKKTTNARLGLLGGISILGTSGIVKPFSTAAYRASVVQAIDVAGARGLSEVVLTTGGKSEAYAMKLNPSLPEEAFIQVGDFIGTGLRHCARKGLKRALIVGMMGKLSKMADGKMMTHAAGSEVNMGLLTELASDLGASAELCSQIRSANTARHVLEMSAKAGLVGITSLVCRRVAEQARVHTAGALDVHVYLVDFDGTLLGRHPPADATERR